MKSRQIVFADIIIMSNVKKILSFGLLSILLSSCSAEITNASLYGNHYYRTNYHRYMVYNNPQVLNLVYSKNVDKYINYFVYQDRSFIERGIEKAIYYSPIVLPILKKYNLPPDFIY
ncbi:MAG: hypothetical protein QXJ62_05645, partial [Nitrososphaeria archaeon]